MIFIVKSVCLDFCVIVEQKVMIEEVVVIEGCLFIDFFVLMFVECVQEVIQCDC